MPKTTKTKKNNKTNIWQPFIGFALLGWLADGLVGLGGATTQQTQVLSMILLGAHGPTDFTMDNTMHPLFKSS